jgi:acyl carrier protein
MNKTELQNSVNMSLHDRLAVYIENKIRELDKELKGELTDETSLIKSGLLDSLALLQLAMWIEVEMNSEVDLATIDLSKEWDTIADIIRFIETQSNPC